MLIQCPAQISVEDWEKTPLRVREYLAQQQAALQEALERLGQNSRNSSLPPSSDRPEQKKPSKSQPSQRKRGGQPGHPRSERRLKPVEEVNEVVPVKPEQCRHCRAKSPIATR